MLDVYALPFGKPSQHLLNGKELLEELADLLKARYGAAEVMYHRKPSASRPADPQVIRQIAERCDYALVAIGD